MDTRFASVEPVVEETPEVQVRRELYQRLEREKQQIGLTNPTPEEYERLVSEAAQRLGL